MRGARVILAQGTQQRSARGTVGSPRARPRCGMRSEDKEPASHDRVLGHLYTAGGSMQGRAGPRTHLMCSLVAVAVDDYRLTGSVETDYAHGVHVVCLHSMHACRIPMAHPRCKRAPGSK